MRKFTAQAATETEAIEKSLREMKTTKDQVTIQVVQESKKGFLGFGRQDAIVVVEKKSEDVSALETVLQATATSSDPLVKDPFIREKKVDEEEHVPAKDAAEEELSAEKEDQAAIQGATDYLIAMIEMLDAKPYTMEVEVTDQRVNFDIESDKAGILIGRHGKVLDALQTLTQIYLYNQADSKIYTRVDVENYRQRKEDKLTTLADEAADRASRTKQAVILEDLATAERKYIHRHLAKSKRVKTHSEGKKDQRYLVVEPMLDTPSVLNQGQDQ